MKLELAEDGYEKIDACIHEIENQAIDGMFKETDNRKCFQAIASETKKLRQIFRDVLLINPNSQVKPDSPGAA
jgi:hypothetical protein